MSLVAWSKEVEQASGVIAAYWVAKSMVVDLVTAKAMVQIEGYISEAAYEHPRAPVVSQSVEIDFSGFDPGGQLSEGVAAMVQAAQG
jgi:hypothetical protein